MYSRKLHIPMVLVRIGTSSNSVETFRQEQTRESQYMVEGKQVYSKDKRHVTLGRGKRAYATLLALLCSALHQ